jgi:hypothetical protein
VPGLTHERARAWAAARIDAEDTGAQGGFHLRSRDGRRIRVAGRHIEGRQPNYFSLGDTLSGDPFDEVVVVLFNDDWSVNYAYRLPLSAAIAHHKQPGCQGCRLMIRGDDSWRTDPTVERRPRQESLLSDD